MTSTNSPGEFDKVYNDELISTDFLMSKLLDAPNRIYSVFGDFGKDFTKKNAFYQECYRIRPFNDACYGPILYRNELTGFIGQVRSERNPEAYDVKDKSLLSFVMPILTSGIEFYINREKVIKLEEAAYNSSETTIIFLRQDGTLEIPLQSNTDLLCEVLREETANAHTLQKNPLLSGLIREMIISGESFHGNCQRLINTSRGYYHLKVIRKDSNTDFLNRYKAIILIEPYNSARNYKLMKQRFHLTKREEEIIRCLFSGKSNREISRCLHIAESTVKRHIANIFEKTESKSRTQLVFQLGCLTPEEP